jgi:hypothetical protein
MNHKFGGSKLVSNVWWSVQSGSQSKAWLKMLLLKKFAVILA